MTASEIAKRNVEAAQKIVDESGYVAPEVRNDWLKSKIADYLARTYSAGIEESKGDSLLKPVVCPEAEASQLRKGQKPSEEFLMRAHEHTHRHLDESFTLIESPLNALSNYIAANECVTFDGAYAQAQPGSSSPRSAAPGSCSSAWRLLPTTSPVTSSASITPTHPKAPGSSTSTTVNSSARSRGTNMEEPKSILDYTVVELYEELCRRGWNVKINKPRVRGAPKTPGVTAPQFQHRALR